MQRSSTKIGALAAALAKAQSEIENPQKSLTATIESLFPRESTRSFRYAPLSAGLDIVRKCLGQHEIATIQATTIDRDCGLIRLTTTLVHASGEWMSSDWPVCPVSETVAPHRMGAALTYARRYALFTLVGIAGEDDLDAPDLAAGTTPPIPQNGALRHEPGPGVVQSAGPAEAPDRAPQRRVQGDPPAGRAAPAQLSPETSASLRDQLLGGIEASASEEALDGWALKAWTRANTLFPLDGEQVRRAFAARLAHLRTADQNLSERTGGPANQDESQGSDYGHGGALALPKERRQRDRQHLRFVAKQPCLVCGRQPCDPHHLRFAQARGLGAKVSDEFTVPLCRAHHRDLHRAGKELDWWSKTGIEPLSLARQLWLTTHPRPSRAASALADLTLGSSGFRGEELNSGEA